MNSDRKVIKIDPTQNLKIMEATEAAKIKISNCLGSSDKSTFFQIADSSPIDFEGVFFYTLSA
jgi:hypothetical protein